jgi:hypothetical protein
MPSTRVLLQYEHFNSLFNYPPSFATQAFQPGSSPSGAALALPKRPHLSVVYC